MWIERLVIKNTKNKNAVVWSLKKDMKDASCLGSEQKMQIPERRSQGSQKIHEKNCR